MMRLNGIFIEGDYYESTEFICKRCNSSVWTTDTPGYSYQCIICCEDLFSFEVEHNTSFLLARH